MNDKAGSWVYDALDHHMGAHTVLVPLRSFFTALTTGLVLVSPLVPASANPPDEAATFDKELAHLRRLVACDTRVDGVVPPDKLTLKAVDASCKQVKQQIARFKKRWLDKAQPFLANVVPSDVPRTVVYPFGGADLLTALTTYPNLETLTTMSLEWVGDPRKILELEAADLKRNLSQQHAFLIKLFQVNHNRTVDLQELNQSPIPAPLVFGLTALELLGYEPVSARWFKLSPDGAVRYLTKSEIAAFDQTPAGKRQKDRNEFFAHMELTFRKVGEQKTRTWRHMRVNLGDDQLKGSAALKYLENQGTIAAMTKAASYLIWREDFGVIRDYLLNHMVWMISDTTGITPFHAAEKGFVQETWGTFQGNMFAGSKKGENAMIELWKTNPQRPLPFQYGYPDKNEHDHMMVTRKK